MRHIDPDDWSEDHKRHTIPGWLIKAFLYVALAIMGLIPFRRK